MHSSQSNVHVTVNDTLKRKTYIYLKCIKTVNLFLMFYNIL